MPRPAKNTTTTPKLSALRSEQKFSTTNTGTDVSLDFQSGEEELSKEGRIILSILSKKLDAISDRLDRRDELIASLTQENDSLKRRVSDMEDRLQHLESHSRRENHILSGREVHKLPSDTNIRQSVSDLIKMSLRVEVPQSSLVRVHRIGVKSHTQGPDKRNILVRFTDSVTRNDILASCRKAKPADLYANEDLIPTRASILFALRQARRKFSHKVTGCGSIDGRVFLFLRPPNQSERSQRLFIDNLQKLDELCIREFGVSSDALLRPSSDQ